MSFVMFVRPSVRMYQPYQHVLAGFSLSMTLGTCTKMSICQNLVKIGQNSGNLEDVCFILLVATYVAQQQFVLLYQCLYCIYYI